MRVRKPQRLSLLTRPYERQRQYRFAISILVGFDFEDPHLLMTEMALWPFVAEQLQEAVLDVGLPKRFPEVLVSARAFPPTPETTVFKAALKFGDCVDKELIIVGDRYWAGSSPTKPQVIRAPIPLDYTRAFGGGGYKNNPLGIGAVPIQTDAGELQPLPNVEDPRDVVHGPRYWPKLPAGFGPYDQMWPQRLAKAGTFDQKWQKEQMPGMPLDADMAFFNCAPEDQWCRKGIEGGEGFSLTNVHPTVPKVSGRVPRIRPRIFVEQQRVDRSVHQFEADSRLETVWLFPQAQKGVLIFRGDIPGYSDDGTDILCLEIAAENIDSPRDRSYYDKEFARRRDPQKGLLCFVDTPIMPELPDGTEYPLDPAIEAFEKQIMPEGHMRANLMAHAQAQLDETRAMLEAEGLDASQVPATVPEPPPLPPTIEGKLAYVEQMQAQGELLLKQAEDARDAELARVREECVALGLDFDAAVEASQLDAAGPPKYSLRLQIEQMYQQLQELKVLGWDVEEQEARLADPRLQEKIALAEKMAKNGYRQAVVYQPPAMPMAAGRAREIREWVDQAVSQQGALRDIDLTGADLSNMDFEEVDFTGSFFESANFAGSTLTRCKLDDAVLARTALDGTRLRACSLTNANLGLARLAGTRFDDCDLSNAAFEQAVFSDALFQECCLDDCKFSEVHAKQTAFPKSSFANPWFFRSVLTECHFAGATLFKALFLQTRLEQVSFANASLRELTFMMCEGNGLDLSQADATNARFVVGCKFPGARFAGAILERANLRGTVLDDAVFAGARMDSADMSETSLQRADLRGVRARGSLWMKADARFSRATHSDFMHALWSHADLRDADISGSSFFGGDLSRVRTSTGTRVSNAILKRTRMLERREL